MGNLVENADAIKREIIDECQGIIASYRDEFEGRDHHYLEVLVGREAELECVEKDDKRLKHYEHWHEYPTGGFEATFMTPGWSLTK